MTRIEQLNKWVAGEPIHNDELEECCPDFSCCQPSLLASEKERRMFRDAYIQSNQDVMDKMLMMFLGAALPSMFPDKKIYVAGDAETAEV